MSTGDRDDIEKRIKEYFPPWFNSEIPLVNLAIKAAAQVYSFIYSFYTFAKKQIRIRTSTGEFIDLAAEDFLGDNFKRRKDESDDDYKNRLLANIFPYPPTRAGMIRALENLTGRTPIIYESELDGGYYNVNLFYNISTYGFDQPYVAYIIAYRPKTKFTGGVYALNRNTFLNRTAFAYQEADFNISVTDQDIYDLINRVKCYGTRIYCCILD